MLPSRVFWPLPEVDNYSAFPKMIANRKSIFQLSSLEGVTVFSLKNPIQLAIYGWMLLILFAFLVLIDAKEPASAIMFAVIALVNWFWLRRSGERLSLIVSTAFGSILLLQQLGYIFAGISDREWRILAEDVLGLASAILIVLGSIVAIRNKKRKIT
jgi:uncharacterized membrane protein YphA (DoxX/SURF4 family)